MALLISGCLLALGGCATVDAGGSARVDLPPESADFDYQLGGSYAPAASVQVVARDSTDAPSGRYDICSLNGFQTRPDESASWLADHPDLLIFSGGAPLTDPGWPGEYLLDGSTAEKRGRILQIMTPLISRCADRGFDAVEFDNLGSWTRSGGQLSFEDNLQLAKGYVAVAHAAGLATAQKNSGDHSAELHDVARFDFAVSEECLVFHTCGAYTAAYGKRVYDIEYTDDGLSPVAFLTACGTADAAPSMILRDRALSPNGAAGHLRLTCND